MIDWKSLSEKSLSDTLLEIVDNFLNVFKNMLDFKTRSGKYEYWSFKIVNSFIGTLMMLLMFFPFLNRGVSTMSMVYWIIALIPGLALLVRRLHDRNHSGWLILLLPLAVLILIFVITIGFTLAHYKGIYGNPGQIHDYSASVSAILTSLSILGLVIYFLVQVILPSTPNENKYGAIPNENVRQKSLANLLIWIYFIVNILLVCAYIALMPRLMSIYPLQNVYTQSATVSESHIPMNVHLVE